MKQYWWSLLLGGWILLLSLPAAAALDKALYNTTVPVASQAAEDLQAALPQALQQVLIQVSGDADIVNSPIIRKQLSQASNLVQSYAYSNDTTQPDTSGWLLKVQFDPRGINQLLRQAGQSPQPAVQHPPLLVWLAVSTGQTYNLVTSDTQDAIFEALRAVAQQHGMTVLLPLGDLQDGNALTTNQIQQLDIPAAAAASQRYQTATFLLGRLDNTATGQWQSEWALVTNGQATHWHINGTSPQTLLQTVFTNVAQTLAKPAAATEQATVQVHISGVVGLDQYADIVSYFRRLAPVNHVEAANVTDDAVTLSVTVAGGASALDQAVQTGQSLLPAPGEDNTATELYYRWLGDTE